ncbi:hypothetical protein OO184_10010 [Photorhabdus sp. APURE]|uniref:hypothetical protein n=1 Tax=Photorhabdus aballayi TaxID=2991723 RepID=UPI00223E61CA|nr:hypothetical protein [Photorhabdus aballayi]MCW7548264.1 hypothetical protein [Photorhabdus aballayi]
MQVAFALKLLTPILIPLAKDDISYRISSRTITLLFVVSFVGVLVNQFYTYPWQGINGSLGGIDTVSSLSTESNPGFLIRVPGFSSTPGTLSFLIISLYLIDTYKKYNQRVGNKSKVFFFDANFILALLTIILSTQKSTLLAFFLCVSFQIIYDARKMIIFKRVSISVLFLIAFVMSYIFPIISFIMYLNGGYSRVNISKLLSGCGEYSGFIASYIDRIVNSWPHFYSLFFEQVDRNIFKIIFGIGLGSVGPAARIIDSSFYNPGDNFLISLIAYFGFLGAGIITFWLVKKIMSSMRSFNDNPFLVIALLSLLGVGSSFNVIDTPIFMIVVFGLIYNKKLFYNIKN